MFLSISKVLSTTKNVLTRIIFGTRSANKEVEYHAMEKVKGSFYIEPIIENSKFAEKVDTSQRFNRFYNSLLNYDYKTGNYVGY